jgi:hypothetical protein
MTAAPSPFPTLVIGYQLSVIGPARGRTVAGAKPGY